MTTLTQLLESNSLFTNVIPVSSFNTESLRTLEHAHTGLFDNLLYAVNTQLTPYKQFIVVIDMDTMKVIS